MSLCLDIIATYSRILKIIGDIKPRRLAFLPPPPSLSLSTETSLYMYIHCYCTLQNTSLLTNQEFYEYAALENISTCINKHKRMLSGFVWTVNWNKTIIWIAVVSAINHNNWMKKVWDI